MDQIFLSIKSFYFASKNTNYIYLKVKKKCLITNLTTARSKPSCIHPVLISREMQRRNRTHKAFCMWIVFII